MAMPEMRFADASCLYRTRHWSRPRTADVRLFNVRLRWNNNGQFPHRPPASWGSSL